MKPTFLLFVLPAVILFAGCTTEMDLAKRISFLGDPAPIAAADRVVRIEPDTKYVVVTGGEIIRFNIGDKSFAWHFDGAGEYHFDLNLVAPPGLLDHKVMAYVNPDPFLNGGK